MKKLHNNSIKGLLVLLTCALFSFTDVNTGGESYTVFLNDKLIIEQHVTSKAIALPVIAFENTKPGDRLSVYYNECGKIGTNRQLSIKDQQGNLLKAFKFTDVTDEHTPVTCLAGDIQKLKPKGTNTLTLFYSSEFVSRGQALATINFNAEKNTAGR